MKKIFRYIEPLWLGSKDQISIRRVLAIAFSIDYIMSNSYAVRHWGEGKSFGELSSVLMIEAGLIAALLTLTTWSTINTKPDKRTSEQIHEYKSSEQIHE